MFQRLLQLIILKQPYRSHILVLFVSLTFLITSFYTLINASLDRNGYLIVFIIHCIALHYLMNIVHISSHSQLHPNLRANRLFGMLAATFSGLTFDDFKATHVLHHKFTDTDKDPDKEITHGGGILTIPFRIWMHDRWFWKKGLWKRRDAWKGYIVNRLLQGAIVLWFFISGNLFLWLFFWLVPIFAVGYANGFFLFYFPHYRHPVEDVIKNRNDPLSSFIKWSISMSRYYHELHHDNTRDVQAYYPVISYLFSATNPLRRLKKKYVFKAAHLDKVVRVSNS